MQISQTYQSPNFNQRPHNNLNAIILHFTEYDFAATMQEFLTRGRVSAHYVIDKNGVIYQCVPDKLRAWHAGISYWRGQENLNDTSLGIELVNDGCEPYASLQLNALLSLLQHLLQMYPDIKPQAVLGHSDIAPDRKVDPGAHFPWAWLAQHGIGDWPDSHAIVEDVRLLAELGDTNSHVREMQSLLANYGYKILPTQIFDQQTYYVVRAFRSHYIPQNIIPVWDTVADTLLKKLYYNTSLQ